jgi:hypothetical protein
MSQPWQLARARKVRRSDRPTVELLPFIRLDDLRPIARNNPHLRECVAPGWKYPHVARLRFSALAIEITTQNGNTESFRLHWISTGQGTQPRAAITCHCGRRTERLFYFRGKHACLHCHRALYKSQRLDQHGRKLFKASKMRLALGGLPNWNEPIQAKVGKKYWRNYLAKRDKIERLEASAKKMRRPFDISIFRYGIAR